MSNTVITRFPPSPTGLLHVGSARTALFNYLFAKHYNGKMVLRMEDTDKERSKREYEEDILAGLKWLGINWEGDLQRQSERSDIYKKHLLELIDSGLAYEAEENKDKTARVIRFKNPNKEISFNDLIRGEIKVDTSDLGDFVIARSVDDPLYHLAVVVDDYDMGITHILRGEDGISNTPRQILLQQALGFESPQYAHIPFILAPDKSKLSKRHGAVSVLEYKKMGYLPEAMVNFLAMLGWRSKDNDERELWSIDELVESFDLAGIQKAGAVFNEEKLRWINREYLRNLESDEFYAAVLEFAGPSLKERLSDDKVKEALAYDLKERIYVYADISELEKQGEFDWILKSADELDYDPSELIWKKSDKETAIKHLQKLINILCDSKLTTLTVDGVEEMIMPYAETEGKGDVLWPLRYALSGQKRSPNPFVLLAALGQDEACMRLHKAIDALANLRA